MENGFVYSFTKITVENLKYLNLVELFKFLIVSFNSQEREKYSRIAVDIFILIKWFFIIIIWILGSKSATLTFIVWYFIVTNIYTYFYYHIWNDDAIDTSGHSNDRIRRRFINLLFSIAFSDFSFAYLYRFPYSVDYANVETKNCIWFSISNSLAANYDAVKPLTDFGNSIAMIQLITTFIFITIIVSRSIPQKN